MQLFIKIILLFSLGSLCSLAWAKDHSLAFFRGVAASKTETEASLSTSLSKEDFCCDRHNRGGNAHDPRYNIEAFLRGESQNLQPDNSSPSGKK